MKSIVVTGGSSGVGAALVGRLLAAGHSVYNVDVRPPRADGDGATYVACDLSQAASIDSAAAQLGGIDGLANVAGIAQAARPETVLAVNFLGLRHLTESLLARAQKPAAVVSVSSIAGRDWQRRYAALLPLLETGSMADGLAWCEAHAEIIGKDPYSFAKRCVTAWTLRSAQAAVRSGVRINCVSPGVIDTPLYPEFESIMGIEHSRWMIAQAGRAATPDDIAEVLDWLLTGAHGWLNGVDIPIDGGYTAGVESGWIDFDGSPLMQRVRAARAARGTAQ
jgi:NAD(P)-dependent dehydrogenase (short-subunit alcohol dehydrogenase family)